MRKKISIIIGGYNEEDNLDRCIKSCLNQNYPKDNYEVIYVDNNSKDKSLEIAKKYPIRVFIEKKLGPSEARNKGIKEAKGEIFLFLDADTKIDKDYLRNLDISFSKKNIGAIGGKVLPIKETVISNYLGVAVLENSPRYMNKRFVRNHPTCNLAVSKKVLNEIGSFKERLSLGDDQMHLMEDKELCERIRKKGYKILYDPSEIVYHKIRDNLKDWFNVLTKGAKTRLFLIRQKKKDALSLFLKFHLPSIYLFIIFISLLMGIKYFLFIILSSLILQLFLSTKSFIETRLFKQSFFIKPFLDIFSLYLVDFIIIKNQIKNQKWNY